ncbi:FISUMP domain-containing protein [Ancylomarina sp. YFZ004]
MKKLFKLSLFLTSIFLLSLFSCEEDDAKNLEPSIPTVLLPIDKAVNIDKQITLSWKTSIDPEKTMVKYTLYLGITEKLTKDDIKVKDQSETEFDVDLAGHATYYWKVVATDAVGLVAETPVASFTTSNSAPTKSVGSAPAHEAIDVAKIMTFKWSASIDGDADVIKYDFYLGTSATLSDSDKKASDLETTEFEVVDMKAKTQYFWKVSAIDAEGDTVDSDVFSFTTTNSKQSKPTAVSPVDAADNITRDITIEWTASVDEDDDKIVYDLFLANKKDYDTNSMAFVAADLKSADLEVTTFDVTELNAPDTYYWKVVAKDTEGVGVESDVFSFTTLNSAPTKSILTFPADKAIEVEKGITFTWAESTDAEDQAIVYHLFYGTDINKFEPEHPTVNNLDKNEFAATSLKGHTEYFWQIESEDSAGAKTKSEVFSFTTLNEAPSKVVDTKIVNIIEDENIVGKKITWTSAIDKDGDAIKYDFYLAKSNEFTAAHIVGEDLEKTEYDALNLDGSSDYFWKIVAKDTQGAISESDVASFTTNNNVPSKASLTAPLDAATGISGSVTLTWDAATDAEGDAITYSVFLTRSDVFGSFPLKTGLTATELVYSNLKGNATYKWKVVAKDAQGGENTSEVFSFITDNSLPTAAVLNSSVSEVINNDALDVTISWAASTDADDEALVYDVYLSEDATFDASDLKKEDFDATEFTFVGLNFTKAYKVKVITKDEHGAKIESNIIDFTSMENQTAEVGTWTDTRDGKVYKTVTVDGQTWLAENFGFIPANMVDGDKQCSVYGVNNSTGRDAAIAHENYSKYGVMYTAHMLADIAPAGWHVATDENWQALEKYSGVPEADLDYSGSTYRGTTVHKFQATDGGWSNTTAPTNELEFGALTGGYLSFSPFSQTDKGMGSYTYFWTNTGQKDFRGNMAYFYRAMSGTKTGISRRNNKASNCRMYVRLVKD